MKICRLAIHVSIERYVMLNDCSTPRSGGEVIPLAWSLKLETIYRSRMSEADNFDTLF